MPAGGVVTVELREETVGQRPDRQSTFVVLEVSDTGVGMDTETRERMFETSFSTKGSQGLRARHVGPCTCTSAGFEYQGP